MPKLDWLPVKQWNKPLYECAGYGAEYVKYEPPPKKKKKNMTDWFQLWYEL